MRGYSTDRAAPHSRPADSRVIPVLYLEVANKNYYGSCSGLRAAGPPSEIRVFDATTNKLKRILSTDGKEVIKEFA